MQPSITCLLKSNRSCIAWRCSLGYCPGTIIVPVDGPRHKPDGMTCSCRVLRQPCWLHLPWILNNWTKVSPANHPHIITSPLPGSPVGTTHADTSIHLLCVSQRHRDRNQKCHISMHQSKVQISTAGTAILFFLLVSFRSDFSPAIQPWTSDSHSLLWSWCLDLTITWALGSFHVGSNLRCSWYVPEPSEGSLRLVFSAAKVTLGLPFLWQSSRESVSS